MDCTIPLWSLHGFDSSLRSRGRMGIGITACEMNRCGRSIVSGIDRCADDPIEHEYDGIRPSASQNDQGNPAAAK
jgi:hypothetical protein